MKKGKKLTLKKLAIWFGLAIVIALIAARTVMHFMLSPDAIVERIERQLNLRANIADTSLSLLSLPARLELKDVSLAPRDEDANNAKSLAERSELKDAAIHFDSIVVEQGIWDLLFGTLDIRKAESPKYKVEFTIEEDGEHTLEQMFDKPKIVASKPNPKFKGEEKKSGGKKEKKKENESKGLTLDSLPLVARLGEMALNNGEIIIHMKKKQSKLHFRDVSLSLSGVEIDPEDLAKGNTGDIRLSGKLTIQKDDETESYAKLDIDTKGKIVFFEESTQKFNPKVNAKLTFRKGSSIDNIPTIHRLYEKLSPLASFGIHLREVNLEGMIQNDATAGISYYENTLTFEEEPDMEMADYNLKIFKGAWLKMDENSHFVRSEVLVSKAHTNKTMDGVFKFLGNSVGQFLSPDIKEKASDYLVRNTRMPVEFTSAGPLSRPKVNVIRPDGDDLLAATGVKDAVEGIKDLLKDKETKDALKGLLKDLLK